MHLILPLRPQHKKEWKSLLSKVPAHIDFVEVWLDHFDQIDLELKRVPESGMRFLGCCKSPKEGGRFHGSPKERLTILQMFLDGGGDFVDLDIQHNPSELIRHIPSEKLMLSFHDFEGNLGEDDENLRSVFQKMQSFSPAMYKFAITTNDEKSLEIFLSWARKIHSQGKIIFSPMGKLGKRGRQILQKEKLTWGEFVTRDKNSRTASGQRILKEIENSP
ncbi:type I 3-dehydroquinate dehydratase [Candidatus Gracilibacteria bacterium]|nr:type I 3-dehydroquinate dehydratase [Candidatus Gracilibacteria bacterium]MCF7819021.1 type I 3-dehydroquinate dehydratase [Candidatus Gracilibacteria bacterium]